MTWAPSRRARRTPGLGLEHAAQQLAGLVVRQLGADVDQRRAPASSAGGRAPTRAARRASTSPTSTIDAPMSSPHSCDGMRVDGDVGDGRVLAQHVLDLAGRDVLAAAHDDVVEAALDEQEAVVVEEAAVAGGEPARRRPRGRRTRPRPARRGPRSRPPRRAATSLAERVADRDLDRGDGGPTEPRRRRTSGSSLAIGVAVVVGRQHGDRRAGLGEAVGVDEVDVRHQRQRPLDDRHRHPAAAVGEVAQRRQLDAVGLHHVEDAAEHRRHDHRVGDRSSARGRRPTPSASNAGRYTMRRPTYVDDDDRRDPGDVVRRHA